ncbi:MAG: DegV family EDD domain-containing protein [Clostridia bacterium]|nr:DegV family EDD domain-containing protein [Clostridia bacterium]
MKVLISTDTSCLVNNDTFKKYEDISVFPLNVIIDGEEFIDGVTINQEELRVAMRSNKKIKTSTPPLGDVIDYYEKQFAKGYDYIIHFTISSKLSSMNELFTNVANENFAGKVTVIDSYGLSSTMLAQVFYAYDEAKKGAKVEDIVKGIEEIKNNNFIAFIPENLVALKNGGRISPSIVVIGNLLGIKPAINLADGELKKDTMIKSVRKAFMERIDNAISKFSPEEYDYTIIAFDPKEEVLNFIYDYAEKKLPENYLIKGIIPINVCAHCGPGTIGLTVSKKVNGKSLKEFI